MIYNKKIKEAISFLIKSRIGGNGKQGNAKSSGYVEFTIEKFSFEESVLLSLALIPHIDPDFYTTVIQKALPQGGEFPEFGGVKGKNHRGILPTGETAQFILGGYEPTKRLRIAKMLAEESKLVKNGLLYLESVPEGEPIMSGKLIMAQDYVDYFLTGVRSKPKFSPEFPAHEIGTELEWDDLVLTKEVKEQIDELRIWVENHQTLMQDWKMAKKIKPGYRVLLYGPSGTGKTLTATLLGKYTGKPVFRVDLSTVVSKYIGETEKNLERLFLKAKNRDWILFFDEADAIFGKRTGVKDAHDRYANQEVSYLLQRIENFDGLVLLSSNFKTNIDDAFLRRFNTIIKFPFPSKTERYQISARSFPAGVKFEKNYSIHDIISDYELSGGNIINVVQYACLKSIAKQSKTIYAEDVIKGIQREVEKEGKIFSPSMS